MADTPLPEFLESEEALRPSLSQIAHRVGVPVFIFSSVFTGSLGVSRWMLLPTLTAVEINGSVRDAGELKDYAADLQTKIATLEGSRDAHVLPLQGTVYRSMTDGKAATVPVGQLVQIFREIAANAYPEAPHAMEIASLSFDEEHRSVEIAGDVHGVGPASMTVLAAFTQALKDDPRFTAVIPPTFSRRDDGPRGTHSPFTISLTLR